MTAASMEEAASIGMSWHDLIPITSVLFPAFCVPPKPFDRSFEAVQHPCRFLDKGKFDPTTLGSLLRLIKEEDIRLMHLHCYGASTFGRLAGLIAGVPTVIHDYDTEVYFPYPWYLRIADTALAPLTGAAIAASPMVRDFQIRKRKSA